MSSCESLGYRTIWRTAEEILCCAQNDKVGQSHPKVRSMTRRMRFLVSAAAGSAIALLLLTDSTSANLQSAMTLVMKFDAFAKSDLPRIFVAPRDGNDAGIEEVVAPELRYDPRSGNLTLNIPPAVVETGETGWEYARLYYFSEATFANDSLGSLQDPYQTAFRWHGLGPNTGPLTEVPVPDGLSLFDGRHFSYTGAVNWDANAIVAANLDFGDVLSKNLSLTQLQSALNIERGMVGTIVYFPSLGGPAFQAPIGLSIVPEPSTVAELLIGAILALSITTVRRRKQQPSFTRIAIAP